MRFPRNAKIVRGHLDPTPFVSVFFCALLFVLLASLVYTPGVVIHLPASASALPGAEGPALTVAMDPGGQLYFQNQLFNETNLLERLRAETARQSEPVTLVVLADKAVTLEQLNHLRDLAVSAGIKQIVQATQPRLFDPPVRSPAP